MKVSDGAVVLWAAFPEVSGVSFRRWLLVLPLLSAAAHCRCSAASLCRCSLPEASAPTPPPLHTLCISIDVGAYDTASGPVTYEGLMQSVS